MCESELSPACFARHFIVPMHRARADFDVLNLRDGRVDVGMRCVTAALFRSQSLRTNVQVSVCFGASARIVQVCGALVRDLRPDERSLADRVRFVATSDAFAPDVEISEDIRAWSRSPTRGFYAWSGGFLDAARRLLEAPAPRPAVVLLTADGKPIERVIERLVGADGALAGGVLVLLGDDRGLEEADELELRALVKETGGGGRAPGAGKVLRASLGGDVLFASHSIVLVNHYLDKFAHSCELREARSYARGVKFDP